MTVNCPGCGSSREITARQHRRNVASGKTTKCKTCQHPREIHVEERHYRYWLQLGGVSLPHDVRAVDWVRVHGLPSEILSLAQDMSVLPNLPLDSRG